MGTKEDNIVKLKSEIQNADALVIGAGAGMSTAAGFTYSGEKFDRYFTDFADSCGFSDMYTGGFMVQNLPLENLWAYWSRMIYLNRYTKAPKPVYEKLLEMVKDKDYFVLTTNVDHCFQRAGFDKERLFYTQGDYGLWQCGSGRIKKTYDNEEQVKKMLLSQGFWFEHVPPKSGRAVNEELDYSADWGQLIPPEKENGETDFGSLRMQIPEELIPYSPDDGAPMTMNLRSDATFVEDAGWHAASERYEEFMKTHRTKKTLFLELGTGMNTPTIIKYNFWQKVYSWPDATYACVNLGEAYAPEEIREKSICIDGDIGEVIDKIG